MLMLRNLNLARVQSWTCLFKLRNHRILREIQMLKKLKDVHEQNFESEANNKKLNEEDTK